MGNTEKMKQPFCKRVSFNLSTYMSSLKSMLWSMGALRRLDPLHKEHEIVYNIIHLFSMLVLTTEKK